MQVAINDPSEYTGGRLCFFVNDQLHVLERPAGSVCQHPRHVLHAVTALTRGTRKSLFVVDHTNGLGEGNVVTVTKDHVKAFLAAPKPAVSEAGGEEGKESDDTPVASWSVEQVCSWIGKAVPGDTVLQTKFREAQIDGSTLLMLDEPTLTEDLGISKRLLRKRILGKINLLKQQ